MKIHECVPQTPGTFYPSPQIPQPHPRYPAGDPASDQARGTWLHNTKLENPLNLPDTMAKEKTQNEFVQVDESREDLIKKIICEDQR